jgi:hypothetical protein
MSREEPMPGELVLDRDTGEYCLVVCVSRGIVWAHRGDEIEPLATEDCEILDGLTDHDDEPLFWQSTA